uniref:Uncharacterized protein n=1 Tax=Anguilla anguilla TaxID=7936 RepID=A0A0E9TML2_ANGAN
MLEVFPLSLPRGTGIWI